MPKIDSCKLGSFCRNELISDPKSLRKDIEPWLTALFQSEHLSLLLGSGFSMGIAGRAKASSVKMDLKDFEEYGISKKNADKLSKWSTNSAKLANRGGANIEDQLRALLQLRGGLEILEDDDLPSVNAAFNQILAAHLAEILASERDLLSTASTVDGQNAQNLLISFLLSFASRTASRERLHIFTTNYDRLIEFGCDLAGLRIVDRFVGTLTPIFRSSRADVDFHYNPPGIRGEPRFLEGVVKLSKLHGSVDWRFENGKLRRYGIAFGADSEHPELPRNPADSVIIYPNPAKDVETGQYPYADLFRDYSAACCRPNSVLVTYGYGFGDDHINRVIADMLTIPSTHLLILAYSDSFKRARTFMANCGRDNQISYLIGANIGSVESLVQNFLPRPSIDVVALRRAELLRNRQPISNQMEPTVGTNESKP